MDELKELDKEAIKLQIREFCSGRRLKFDFYEYLPLQVFVVTISPQENDLPDCNIIDYSMIKKIDAVYDIMEFYIKKNALHLHIKISPSNPVM